jgi:hypothetical protein
MTMLDFRFEFNTNVCFLDIGLIADAEEDLRSQAREQPNMVGASVSIM